MVMELIKDNRKIVDRITKEHIDTFVNLLTRKKVCQSKRKFCGYLIKCGFPPQTEGETMHRFYEKKRIINHFYLPTDGQILLCIWSKMLGGYFNSTWYMRFAITNFDYPIRNISHL